ncbi:MAG: hypothetical protein GY810_25640 [Aureispira sp.]|nr:hypothetical protein [Aureispira sp.]
MTEINLNFMHPTYGTTFNADIDSSFTVEEMITNLLHSGFLPPNDEGYQLALRKQIFDSNSTFDSIENLYDGDIIRIVTGNQAQDNSSAQLVVNLKHPTKGIVLDLQVSPDIIASDLIQMVLDKGFIQGLSDQYTLVTKGLNELNADQPLSSAQVSHQDFIQIVQIGSSAMPAIAPMLYTMSQQLEQLETGMTKELDLIKSNMPALNTIPIDAKRAINPTEEAYQSIDSIVGRLRSDAKLPPLKPIRSINFMPFLITVGIIALIIGFYFFLKAITLFY